MAVVHPCDSVSLSAALDAHAAGLIEPVLVGPRARLAAIAQESDLKIDHLDAGVASMSACRTPWRSGVSASRHEGAKNL
jgi:hypothetical protein